MTKKLKVLFIISIILTVILLAAEVFTLILGIDSLRVIYNPSEDLEGIALIVLLPFYILFSVIVLVTTIIMTVFNVICIRKRYKRGFTISSLVVSWLINISNVALFIAMIAK